MRDTVELGGPHQINFAGFARLSQPAPANFIAFAVSSPKILSLERVRKDLQKGGAAQTVPQGGNRASHFQSGGTRRAVRLSSRAADESREYCAEFSNLAQLSEVKAQCRRNGVHKSRAISIPALRLGRASRRPVFALLLSRVQVRISSVELEASIDFG
jgi:hypothetical protein